MIYLNDSGSAIILRDIQHTPLQFEKNGKAFILLGEKSCKIKVYLKNLGNDIWISKIREYYAVKEIAKNGHISHYKYVYGFYIWNNGILFTEIIPDFESIPIDFVNNINYDLKEPYD